LDTVARYVVSFQAIYVVTVVAFTMLDVAG
jgi:hypothetical protein